MSPEIKTQSRKRPVPRERLLVISLLGIVVGATGGLVAEALLRAINFLTDLFFYGKFSSAYLPPNEAPHHWWLIFLPAAGGPFNRRHPHPLRAELRLVRLGRQRFRHAVSPGKKPKGRAPTAAELCGVSAAELSPSPLGFPAKFRSAGRHKRRWRLTVPRQTMS